MAKGDHAAKLALPSFKTARKFIGNKFMCHFPLKSTNGVRMFGLFFYQTKYLLEIIPICYGVKIVFIVKPAIQQLVF